MRISDWSSDVCSSDLSGFATGVALSGATDAVSVDFAGAALSVTSTGANATGITTQDGTDVTITTAANAATGNGAAVRSEEHTSELQSLMRISYAVFCLKKKKQKRKENQIDNCLNELLVNIIKKQHKIHITIRH